MKRTPVKRSLSLFLACLLCMSSVLFLSGFKSPEKGWMRPGREETETAAENETESSGENGTEASEEETEAPAESEETEPSSEEETEGPEETESPAETETEAVEIEKAAYTVMIYMIGSDLEYADDVYHGYGTEDILEMQEADIPENANVILQCGGTEKWMHEDVPDDTVSRLRIVDHQVEVLEELGIVPMTSYGSLSDFITYCSENYPAEKYVLVMWDHGGGSPIRYGSDLLSKEGDGYTEIEIGQELERAGVKFETVVFDACLMGSLEMGLSIKNMAKYMVAAESTVIGLGTNYAVWLSALDDTNDPYYEVIVEAYKEVVEEYNLVSSMSVIRLRRIDEVYMAYEAYIKAVAQEFSECYADYVKARSACGVYESTDSVDLTTLANNYWIKESTLLMNTITNATVYTYSSIAYGHGLTAYSPFVYVTSMNEQGETDSMIYDYTKSRKTMIALNYSDEIIDFYDSLMSFLYASYYPNYVRRYISAQKWFKSEWAALAENQQTASDVPYELTGWEDEDGYLLPFDDEVWELINTEYMTVYMTNMEEGYILYLGNMYKHIVDDLGYVRFREPQTWLAMNGYYCSVDCIGYSTGEDYLVDSVTYRIPVMINDETCYLYVYYDAREDQIIPLYYYSADFTESKNTDTVQRILVDEDQVSPVVIWIETDGSRTYTDCEAVTSAAEMDIDFYDFVSDYEGFEVTGSFQFTDIYGGSYYTPFYPLAKNNGEE